MTVVEVTFSGIPAWLLSIYLVELGGTQEGERTARGEGWTARLVPQKTQVGGFRIGRVRVTITGPAAQETMEALRRKARRGGG